MQTNNHKIADYDIVLDSKFGQEGTPSAYRQRKMPCHSTLDKSCMTHARKHVSLKRNLPRG